MPEDKDALIAALVARTEQHRRQTAGNDEQSQEMTEALTRYRHFIDDLNRSSERDMQLAELRC